MNLVMFIPLGLILPKRWSTLIKSFLAILTVETCQYVFHLGGLDLGDVTLNILSIALGMGLAMMPLSQKLKVFID